MKTLFSLFKTTIQLFIVLIMLGACGAGLDRNTLPINHMLLVIALGVILLIEIAKHWKNEEEIYTEWSEVETK